MAVNITAENITAEMNSHTRIDPRDLCYDFKHIFAWGIVILKIVAKNCQRWQIELKI
jgi:hypothetical protein